MLPLLLAFASSAHAGAGLNFTPGVEGQDGFGAPVVSADGRLVALTSWNHVGLSVLDLQTGAVETVTDARGAGFSPVWDGEALLFKAIAPSAEGPSTQEAWRWSEGRLQRLDAGPRIGQPAVLSPGHLLWTHGDGLGELEGAAFTSLPGVGDVDLLAAAPDGTSYAWNDGSGNLHLRELSTGTTLDLQAPGTGFRPSWSPDGGLLATNSYDGRIVVTDPVRQVVVATAEGAHPRWIPGTHTLVFDRTETSAEYGQESGRSAYEVVSASLWTLNADTGVVALRLDDDRVHPRFATPSPNGDVLFVDTTDGALWRLRGTELTELLVAGPAPAAPPPSFEQTAVSMPYMHQLWDTPDSFDGGWSCGPTSCVQVLAKWSVLPNADITASWPSAHTSHWGWYIPNTYSFNGYTYDAWGVAKSQDCQGAHGFVCRQYGGAVWAYMTSFMNQHGVGSAQVGTDYNTLISETNAGYPMMASASVLGYGHIIAIRGYLTSGGSAIHSFVTNDPYGNAGTGDWGNFDGEGAVYDWPGYDNGYLEIGISQLFSAHGTAPVVEEPAEEEPAEEQPAAEQEPTAAVDTGLGPAPYAPYAEPNRSPSPGTVTAMDEVGGCDAAGTRPGAGAVIAALGTLILGSRRRR